MGNPKVEGVILSKEQLRYNENPKVEVVILSKEQLRYNRILKLKE